MVSDASLYIIVNSCILRCGVRSPRREGAYVDPAERNTLLRFSVDEFCYMIIVSMYKERPGALVEDIVGRCAVAADTE